MLLGIGSDIRIFVAHIGFGFVERQFNDWSRVFAVVRVPEQEDLHVLVPKAQEGLRPIAGNTGHLNEQCQLRPKPLVFHIHFGGTPQRSQQPELVLHPYDRLRLLFRAQLELFHEPLLHLSGIRCLATISPM